MLLLERERREREEREREERERGDREREINVWRSVLLLIHMPHLSHVRKVAGNFPAMRHIPAARSLRENQGSEEGEREGEEGGGEYLDSSAVAAEADHFGRKSLGEGDRNT